MKTFRGFIKPLEAPKRNVKIKISVDFFSSSRIEAGRVNIYFEEAIESFVEFQVKLTFLLI